MTVTVEFGWITIVANSIAFEQPFELTVVILRLYVVDTPPTMALMVGVPVILKIPVPLTNTGSSMVNRARGLFSMSTLKA